jgi:hypothetical protein
MATATFPSGTHSGRFAPLWLHSAPYDLTWYFGMCFVPFILFVPMTWWLGSDLDAYVVEAILFGVSHNFLTWALMFPGDSRNYYRSGVLIKPIILASLCLIPLYLWFRMPGFQWAILVENCLGLYHVIRQHQGIIQAYDGRYILHTGDTSFRDYIAPWRHIMASYIVLVLAWKLTGPPPEFHIPGCPTYFLPIPVLSLSALIPFALLWLFFASRFAFQTVQLTRAGLPLPVGHLVVGGAAMLNATLAMLFIPHTQGFLLTLPIAAFHNIQYFGFCWTHHRQRANLEGSPKDCFTRWAKEARWQPYFSAPFLYAACFLGYYAAVTPAVATLVGTWFQFVHYLTDGFIWRRRYYPAMGQVVRQPIAAEAPATS